MSVATTAMTADELLRLPDDGFRYELVRGELRKMPPAGSRHGQIALRMSVSLYMHVCQHGLGESYAADTGFIIAKNPDTVRAPDASFVRKERVAPTDHYVPGPPDLAIEVISPSDLYIEVAEKTREYLSAGTRAVVIVDPRTEAVHVHRASSVTKIADTLEVEDVVPGWKMTLAEIFAE